MRLDGFVEKGWGREIIFATNDKYCGKILHFKATSQSSMHFHAIKDETWYVLDGVFQLCTIDTVDATKQYRTLSPGDTTHIPPLMPHQLSCIETGCIVEVSTPDSVEDNYRIIPGDSQQ